MKHRKLFKWIFLVLLLMIGGCRNTPAASPPVVENTDTPTMPAPTRTKLSAAVPSPTPAEMSTPTSLPILTSTLMPTLTPTATRSPLEKARLKIQCLEILPEFPPGVVISGTLVLADAWGDEISSLLDMASGNLVILPESIRNELVVPHEMEVSPDGNWLAYEGPASVESTIYELVVRNLDGSQQYVYPKDTGALQYAQLRYWINNEWLAFIDMEDPLDILILINPFTGEQQVMPNDYPDIALLDDFSEWQTHVSYNPSFQRVVYLGWDPEGGSEGFKLVLWDLTAGQSITEIPIQTKLIDKPEWSRDGNSFIYVSKDLSGPFEDPPYEFSELVLVTQNGEAMPLTQLTEYYSQTSIANINWSPDGHSLAFLLSTKDTLGMHDFRRNELAVLNLTNLEVTNYCLQADSLVWSLDSQYLAFSISDRETRTNRVLVADLAGGYAVQVPGNFRPEGWMRSGP